MKRRDAIKRTAMIMGYAISASAIAGVMNGCKADPSLGTSWKPAFFDADQINVIAEIAERILPATDTPGAKDVLVHQFMDKILKENFDADAQQRVFSGLKAIETASQSTYKKSFLDCSNEEKDAILTQFDKMAHEANKTINGETQYELVAAKAGQVTTGEGYLAKNKTHFFHIIKELTFLGYFTSETVATTMFNYDPIPGPYQGCTDLPENGAAWAF